MSDLARGLWVWNTMSIFSSNTRCSALLTGARSIGIRDLYLHMAPAWYSLHAATLHNFILGASDVGIRVWALDGDRAYLEDSEGPANFYAGIENLIAYNSSVYAEARFYGFQADIEPQDDGTRMSFHNEIPDQALSTKPRTGVWQLTEAKDREELLRSWIAIHHTVRNLLHANGLRFGAAMPFWTESYYGEEVQVSYPSSSHKRQGVMKYMMPLLDEYVVMSYNTSPANAASRVAVQAAYASTLPVTSRPRVFGSMEVTAGVGTNVSYADTPGKDTRTVVLQDLDIMIDSLKHHAAFKGMALHHWSSWENLRP